MLLQTSHRQLPVRCRSSPIASPLPLLLKPSLILFQPCPTILKPTVAVAQQPALSSCSWSSCGNGCVIHDQPPHDTCCVGGCNAKFHHACQTQWEFYQYPRMSLMVHLRSAHGTQWGRSGGRVIMNSVHWQCSPLMILSLRTHLILTTHPKFQHRPLVNMLRRTRKSLLFLQRKRQRKKNSYWSGQRKCVSM